jgi:hypothetical protein
LIINWSGLPPCAERAATIFKYPEAAPTNKAIVDRLGWTIVGRSIAPSQAVPDNKDDAADDPAIIHSWQAVRRRRIRLDPAHLRLRKSDQITYRNASLRHH